MEWYHIYFLITGLIAIPLTIFNLPTHLKEVKSDQMQLFKGMKYGSRFQQSSYKFFISVIALLAFIITWLFFPFAVLDLIKQLTKKEVR